MKRILVVVGLVLLIALVISAGLNMYLYRVVRQYYGLVDDVRLDPLGLGTYPVDADQRDLTDPERITIVFYGDSRAQFWPAPEGLDRFQFINRGIAGQMSSQVLLRFDRHVRPLAPDMILLQVCVNDLVSIPIFPERRDKIVADCEDNIAAVVEASLDIKATVILTTIFPVGEPSLMRRFVWSDDIAAAVNEVNRFIRAQAAEKVLVFDTYALLVNDQGLLRDDYRVDSLHLSAAGYAVLNSALTDLLADVSG